MKLIIGIAIVGILCALTFTLPPLASEKNNMNGINKLITGTDLEVDQLMSGENALIVDYRCEEQEVLSQLDGLVSDFTYEDATEKTAYMVTMKFRGKELQKEYQYIPDNFFRIIQDAQSLFHPELEIRAYKPSLVDDTLVFVINQVSFWKQFEQQASSSRKDLFGSIAFLEEFVK